ncbi:hypothetical protein CSIM01_06832 [Colletotrichum simmondsii]|uniref:Uncharacterized protein n=1 Tax=Colletotrichum simmondsii TaxID=703756 RepID=A0A135TF80_9PEZI|nr:hypothetical protein CSIM01_06832 [Colletotrichum simmondsii]
MLLQPSSSLIIEGIRQARRKAGDRITTTDVVRQQAEVAATEPPVLPRQPAPSPPEPVAADTEPAVDTGPEAVRRRKGILEVRVGTLLYDDAFVYAVEDATPY